MPSDDHNMRPLKEGVRFIDWISETYQPLIFISFFCIVGLYFLYQGAFVLNDENITTIGAIQLCIGIAIALWWVFNWFFFFAIHFGPWHGFITQGQLSPGDTFQFRFEQHFRLSMAIESIGVFLIFRETVDSVSEGGYQYTETVDRLVQGTRRPERVFAAGEVLVEECVFQIPNRPMGIRNDFRVVENQRVSTSWWVKVRLVPATNSREEELNNLFSPFIPKRKKLLIIGQDDDFWREFEIEVQGEATTVPGEQDDLFDVYLSEKNAFLDTERRNDVAPFVPHLDKYQLMSRTQRSRDTLLREHVSGPDAQEMKAHLAASGLEVRLEPISKKEG